MQLLRQHSSSKRSGTALAKAVHESLSLEEGIIGPVGQGRTSLPTLAVFAKTRHVGLHCKAGVWVSSLYTHLHCKIGVMSGSLTRIQRIVSVDSRDSFHWIQTIQDITYESNSITP